MKPKKLTEKERRFVNAYLGPAKGNATKAVILAGYNVSVDSSTVYGSKLLRKVHVRAAIDERVQKEDRAAILSAEERDKLLAGIAKNELEDSAVRVRAVSELNKCDGRHSMRHVHEGKLTLEQVLGQSRE